MVRDGLRASLGLGRNGLRFTGGFEPSFVDIELKVVFLYKEFIQGVPCARGLGFVDLDLECSTTLLGQ